METFIQHLIIQIQQTQKLEWAAALFGVASVLFSWKNHIALYPTGIVSTAIYAYMWSQSDARLYADALLNLYYLGMSIYGWLYWAKNKNDAKILEVSLCNKQDWKTAIAIVIAGWGILYIMLRFTPSNVPVWDSFVSATAWSGMWLLARRKVENWLLLNISNLAAIPLFIYKGYYVTMLLTVFLFIVAIFGYFNWRKIYHHQTTE